MQRRIFGSLLPRPAGQALARVRRASTVRIRTHDGHHLATDVHRPGTDAPVPTVLIRTSYGRNGLTGIPMVAQAKALAALGYAVVLQDVRGRFDSTGEFVPMVNEVADARATIDWITDQPWSDGTIGAWGLSYLGGTAWAAAVAAPARVRALSVGITHSAVGLPETTGLVYVDTGLRWLRSLDAMARLDDSAARRLANLVRFRLPGASDDEAFSHLPLLELDERVLGSPSPIWRTWAEHPDANDPFWQPGNLSAAVTGVAPTSHLTGWWDLFVDRHLDDVDRQSSAGRVDRLVVGPWGHLDGAVQVRAFAEMRRHFDRHLRGIDRAGPAVELWIAGAERWWTGDRWPATTTRTIPFDDLRSPTDRLVFDPSSPTPKAGGRILSVDAGPVDCTDLAARDDVVTLTGPPLPHPLVVVGRPTVTVDLLADTGHTDLWIRLAEVDVSGRARSISDGFLRLRDLRGRHTATVELHPVGHQLRAGNRLRVHVAGGAFPHHDRSLGLDGDRLHLTDHRPTTVRIHDGRLELPVHVPDDGWIAATGP